MERTVGEARKAMGAKAVVVAMERRMDAAIWSFISLGFLSLVTIFAAKSGSALANLVDTREWGLLFEINNRRRDRDSERCPVDGRLNNGVHLQEEQTPHRRMQREFV